MSDFTFYPDDHPIPVMTVTPEPSNSVLMYAGGDEMLRVAKDGFYVRGQKVPVDDNEGLAVYRAFRNFLAYHALSRP
jgi:hypothetical protein